jgi:hypothetical protein
MIRAKTQIWIGIALCVVEIFAIGFEEVYWGYIAWENNLILFATGPFIAIQGYYRLQKQRNAPPKREE